MCGVCRDSRPGQTLHVSVKVLLLRRFLESFGAFEAVIIVVYPVVRAPVLPYTFTRP